MESSINSNGKLLVPLVRSQSVNNQLNTFPVEVIYCMVGKKLSPFGTISSQLPGVDLLVSQLMWSVYLPNDYSYLYFTSSLEKEEMIRGLNVLAGVQRQYDKTAVKEMGKVRGRQRHSQIKKIYKGKDYKSSFRNVPMAEEQMVDQVDNELDFSDRLEGLARQEAPQASLGGGYATGVLPIQIHVPTGGQVYRFARTIINPDDLLTFGVRYAA